MPDVSAPIDEHPHDAPKLTSDVSHVLAQTGADEAIRLRHPSLEPLQLIELGRTDLLEITG